MSIYVPGKLVLSNSYDGLVDDADANAYLAAVQAVDGQLLEGPVRQAVNTFIKGCKADGIWSAIKASCILAGARTRLGALTPLVGTAPTSFNFVDGDYNRKTGLVGNRSTKYLNSNRNNNADPQDNNHNSVYVTALGSSGAHSLLAAGDGNAAGTNIIAKASDNGFFTRNRSGTGTSVAATMTTGFAGTARSVSTSYNARNGGQTHAVNVTSDGNISTNVLIFTRSTGGSANFSDARLAFYSIGESLDLALLDARVTDLINAFGAVIP